MLSIEKAELALNPLPHFPYCQAPHVKHGKRNGLRHFENVIAQVLPHHSLPQVTLFAKWSLQQNLPTNGPSTLQPISLYNWIDSRPYIPIPLQLMSKNNKEDSFED